MMMEGICISNQLKRFLVIAFLIFLNGGFLIFTLDSIKKDKERKKWKIEKDKEKKKKAFIKRIHFVESIDKAIKLSTGQKYEASNKIYEELLSHKGDEDIDKYIDHILANMGINYIKLGLLDLARKCFEDGIYLNPDNETILDGIKQLEDN